MKAKMREMAPVCERVMKQEQDLLVYTDDKDQICFFYFQIHYNGPSRHPSTFASERKERRPPIEPVRATSPDRELSNYVKAFVSAQKTRKEVGYQNEEMIPKKDMTPLDWLCLRTCLQITCSLQICVLFMNLNKILLILIIVKFLCKMLSII